MADQIGQFEKVRALAANNKLVVVGGVRTAEPSDLTFFDHVAGKLVARVKVPSHIDALALHGERVVAGCKDGVLRLFNAKGEAQGEIRASSPVNALAVHPDGERVFAAFQDGWVRVFSLERKAKLAEWLASPQALWAIAVEPNGEAVAAAGDDGVVRSWSVDGANKREMPGHVGPVYSLAFTPRDGRLCSAGEDGKLRFWYLAGAVEFEERGSSDGHQGAILAIHFPPTPPAQPGEEPIDRVVSAGEDGKLKVWRLDKKIKPKGIDLGSKAIYALAFALPLKPDANSLGRLFGAGDSRKVSAVQFGGDGTPADAPSTTWNHGFDELGAALAAPAKPRREQAVKDAAAMEEPEALELAIKALSSDKDPEVRALAAKELAARNRRGARPALRDRLNDDQFAARTAALAALRELDKETPLVPLRYALSSKWSDIRVRALRELPALRETSPLVPGLIADALNDADPAVGLVALDELQHLYPGSDEPVRIAFEKGPAHLKVEGLIRSAFAGWTSSTTMRPVVARALDDGDANVRRTAFAVRVLERRPLTAALEAKDEDFGRTVKEVARRGAQLRKGPQPAPAQPSPTGQQAQPTGPTEAEIKDARGALPGQGNPGDVLNDGDFEPLLAAMACRTPDTALRGSRGMAQLGDPRALGALLQLSREGDANIRKDAASALKELSDPRARARLVWMLDDADANVRGAALNALTSLATTGPLQLAEEALRSAFEDIRVRGLERLVKSGTEGARPEGAEALLGDALEDEAAKVRDEAFRTLWAWHTKDPQKALDRALDGRFPDLRVRAIKELEAKGQEGWAQERLLKEVGDRDANVAMAAYEAAVKLKGKEQPEPHLLALASIHPTVRAAGARGAAQAPGEGTRSALIKLFEDDFLNARVAAVDALNKLFPADNAPLVAGLGSSKLDVRVQAAEHLAPRHDDNLVAPMRALLADKELAKQHPAVYLTPLRQRAATALATLGATKLLKYFATELLKDDDPLIREQAARGLATAARRGDEGYLLDALGHADVPVRSWAADGLSRLGDVRALPVLIGNLRHNHLPIRLGSILSFAALGAEGDSGMLHGLEDSAREVQEMVFAIVLSRDLAAFRAGKAPDLLTSALSSGRPEVRFAAARALELRTDSAAYLEHLTDVLHPPKPEKASEMKDWPSEEEREKLLVGLAGALSGSLPEQRYAAAQVLLLKSKPLEYFREAGRVGRLASIDQPWVPDTAPRQVEKPADKPKGFLRRLFASITGSGNAEAVETEAAADHGHLRRLAFGAYVGLLRQVVAGDDEGHRVRRDAIDRIVALTQANHVSPQAATAAMLRALDDPHHLVRKQALAGLKAIYPAGSDEPLALALAATSADVGRQALDELAARGEAARPRIVAALNSNIAEVRKYAFDLLERLSPPGSLDPLLAALGSIHADLRIGVIERLANSNDPRVTAALSKAMESSHEDLRLRAAELLAARGNDLCIDVLATFLRNEDNATVRNRATAALVRLATNAAVRALVARMEEVADNGQRAGLAKSLAQARNPTALIALAARFEDDDQSVRTAAFGAALELAGTDRKKRDLAKAMQFLPAAVHAHDHSLRLAAANELDFGDDAKANDLLTSLFPDRELEVRKAAVAKYARRVIEKGAPVGPLEDVLKAGSRELMLPAAEGVAERHLVSALRPLLLYVRAGEGGERERALVALGALGDARGLAELELVAQGGTEEAPADVPMQAAAHEGLGRLHNQLSDPEAKKRILERLEAAASDAPASPIRISAIVGLRHIGGERARIKLEQVLGDQGTPYDVGLATARELGKLGDVGAEQALAKALDHYNNALRAEARKSLDALFPNERTRVEFLAVDSKQSDIAEPAASYLATEGDPRLLVPRLATLKAPALRARLMYGLSRRNALPAEELSALLSHDQPEAREQAAWLVGARSGAKDAALSGAEVQKLGAGLEAAERKTAERWAKATAQQRPAEARAWARLVWAATCVGAGSLLATARKLLASSEVQVPAQVRLAAARALAKRGSASDADALLAALADADPGVREAAASALAKHAPDRAGAMAVNVRPFDPVAFAPVGPSLVDARALESDEARRVAMPAAIGARNVAALEGLVRARGGQAKLDALAALGRMPSAQAIAALEKAAFDKAESEDVRKAAYRALRRAKRLAAKQQPQIPAGSTR